ncbi:MAG: tripartite tricarboxylate transporter substrate binding protein, partial [Comamonadaceae bacterium]
MRRRTFVHTALAVSWGAALPALAQPGAWPTGKAITYLVPFPAGG